MLVVFATNIKPSELVDEAFLRRIHYKVFAENPTHGRLPADFRGLLPRARPGLRRRLIVEHLLDALLRPRSIRLRGCHPRDLIEQALAHAEYLGEPRELTPELLEAACAGYFVDDTERVAVRRGRAQSLRLLVPAAVGAAARRRRRDRVSTIRDHLAARPQRPARASVRIVARVDRARRTLPAPVSASTSDDAARWPPTPTGRRTPSSGPTRTRSRRRADPRRSTMPATGRRPATTSI